MILNENDKCICLCLQEHWKSSTQLQNYVLQNFKLVSCFCRDEGAHGGSAIFLRNDIKFRDRCDIVNLSTVGVCEVASVELMLDLRKVVVMSLYRPPGCDVGDFLNKLECMLNITVTENCDLIISGDFNIDLSKKTKTSNDFLSMINSYGLYQTNSAYTRETNTSASCIDNILTNIDTAHVEVIDHMISDHKSVRLTFDLKFNETNFKIIRQFSDSSIGLFRSLLSEQDWLDMYLCPRNDLNGQWSCFYRILYPIFNECFPSKRVRNNTEKVVYYKNSEVVKCKNELDVLYVLSSCDVRYRDVYNLKKKEYNEALKTARKKYYSTQINLSENKTKTTWKIVEKIKGKPRSDGSIKISGDPVRIANGFNEFYINNILNLTSELEHKDLQCAVPYNRNSMFIEPTTENEIYNIIHGLKSKMSSGYDEFPTLLIKRCICELCKPLTYMVNNSLLHGVFPDPLKRAVVSPIFKKGNPQAYESYRPISLLSSFSKIFEIAMSSRIINFFTKYNLFSETQHGYLRGRSVDTAVHNFVQDILQAFENKEVAMGMFLDLTKAFDCLNYSILFEKLERYGVRGLALRWIRSYLSGRTQSVSICRDFKKSVSENLEVKIGIPQGSVLGPLIFIIYINDLGSILKTNKISLVNFADDSNFLIRDDARDQAILKSEILLNDIKQYMLENRLILNENKTNYVVFRTSQSNIDTSTISINNENIDLVRSVKFLGIFIDENLNWQAHMEYLLKRLNSVSYSMRVLKQYLDESTLKTLYFSNYQSILRYGIVFWGQSSEVKSVFICQKRTLRVLCNMGPKDTCRSVFKSRNILTVAGLYIFETIMFLKKNFSLFSSLTSQSTRTMNLNYPIHRLAIFEKGCYYSGIVFFNKLPNALKQCKNIRVFKGLLYSYICSIEPYTIKEFCDYSLLA